MKIVAALTALSIVASPTAADEHDSAFEVLQEITVVEDHPMNEYDRESFAPNGWIDANSSGCTTREDILARDLNETSIALDSCTVEYGQTVGAYSGEQIEHVQGSSEVDIEHVVAIGQAWRNGAHAWDETTRQEFYQDQENLIAVGSSQNQSKSDQDASEYLPPNQGVHCEFAATTVYIKDKYDLAMNATEHNVIAGILSDAACEGTPAAPAQAMYTSDWQAHPDTAGPDNNVSSFLSDIPTLAVAGLAAVVVVSLAILILVPTARKTFFRFAKRKIRSNARRGMRSFVRK